MNGFDSSTTSASSRQENLLARCIEAESTYKTSERGRSPVQIPCLFVSKLYEMLGDCELDKEKGKIVSWLPDGKSFRVHKPKEVIKDILPTYFNQSKYKSFQRQLNLWGFDRITAIGPNKGAYRHPNFQRDQPLRVESLRRIRAIPKIPAKIRRKLEEKENADKAAKKLVGEQAANRKKRAVGSKVAPRKKRKVSVPTKTNITFSTKKQQPDVPSKTVSQPLRRSSSIVSDDGSQQHHVEASSMDSRAFDHLVDDCVNDKSEKDDDAFLFSSDGFFNDDHQEVGSSNIPQISPLATLLPPKSSADDIILDLGSDLIEGLDDIMDTLVTESEESNLSTLLGDDSSFSGALTLEA